MTDSLSFKTIHASVRPARIAVLVNNSDANWQDTSLRIIEFNSRLWGGAYNLIIPTDGATIDERFWAILETFDPDYVYRYQKSGEDLYLSNPDRYDRMLQTHVDEYVKQFGSADPSATRIQIDNQLRRSRLSTLQIEPTLQNEIKIRLAPFYSKGFVVDPGAISANSVPAFPLTDITKILLNTDHPDRVATIDAPTDTIPKLWFSAVCGLLNDATIRTLEHLKITPKQFPFGEDNVDQLIELTVAGAIRRPRRFRPDKPIEYELEGIVPFQLSMLQLGLYRSVQYPDWAEPLVIVAGNGFEDFCLYYCLSRLRDRVVWVLPSITEKALSSNSTVEVSRAERNFLFQLLEEERSSQSEAGIACVTYSLKDAQVDAVIEHLNSRGIRRFREIRKTRAIQHLVRFPLIANERDNFQRDLSVQFANDMSVGLFNTPKPKNFDLIHPSEHRYITQLSVAREQPPKHFHLGTWIIADHRLSTYEARLGSHGPAYFCPNVAYFGGDIDTVLVRPRLHLPPLDKIVEELARTQSYQCRPSDKGIYADDSIAKWGGLGEVGSFLRDSSRRALLDKFLDSSKSQPGKGVYLSDRRRYLDFQAIKNLVGETATALIDGLIAKQILYRGFIFGCSYCRNADWFSVSEITQEFKCKRCGRVQIYSKANWKMPDEPAWFYKLDELVYQGYRQGMSVSLLALDYLRITSSEMFIFTTDREFWKPPASKPDVEADLFCVPEGILTIGEAKMDNSLGSSTGEEDAKIRKYKQLVTGLSARQFVLATLSESWSNHTIQSVIATFSDLPFVRVRFFVASQLLEPQKA